MGADLFHADGQVHRQTDKMKLTAAFRNFTNAPKNAVTEKHTLRSDIN